MNCVYIIGARYYTNWMWSSDQGDKSGWSLCKERAYAQNPSF